MNIFLSLFIILIGGILGGFVFEKIRLPKLVWYIILGILIGPSLLNIVDDTLLSISSFLRQIALVIILTRSGLSLDINNLKKIGRSAIMMCFLPACFEIIGILIFAPIFLSISYFEALLLGSVLAAVSPAIVVPRMIKLMDEGYGKEHCVPELIMAGSSFDDIFVIVLFYSFKNLVSTSTVDVWGISQIPISIITGVILGIITGFLMIIFIKYLNFNKIINVIFMLGLSFGMIALENILKPYFSVSSLLGIIVMAFIINIFNKEESREIQKTYNGLWQVFEILLFTLVGIATNVYYAFSKEGLIIIGLVLIALIFRSIGVFICLIATKFTWKEKIFTIISYLPKATVQASIGAIALTEGLACGTLILTAAVVSILITAPLGAILIDNFYKKLLIKDDNISIKLID
ncbi:MAG: cation:proton antiporter [Mollicutes bacterium]|nr:cation:proton antiporter [Mollicutes bacterium]MDD7264470.1 cation:proton antiporter [bacterium]MDY4979414.1 cation:proton antiporter [Candidatus Onthovivens sp.]